MKPFSRTTAVLRTALHGSRALTWLSAVMGVLLLVAVVGLVADGRTVGGQPTWLKPAKFASSFIAYGLSLAWMIGHLRRGRRTARWAAYVIVVMSVLEVGIIVFQAARGRASHYNEATPLDEALWNAMGATIAVLWVATAVLAVLLWRGGMPDRTSTWAVRLGMVLLLLGLLQGFTMVVPTAEQLALDEQGVETLMGAHAVGVSDGGPGMPLTGWSTTGGDLRIGHFVGMHGLQAVLLFAMLVPALVGDVVRRTRLVVVFSFAYAGLLVLVTWQALRGQPLLAPDALTLAVAGGLLAVTAVAGVLAVAPAGGMVAGPSRVPVSG
ncbi:hypothetical protein Cme02nite_64110 [Catellatospora methionotrophica]|uniref:Uncharacterized protein n=1 Tax=Catellatospora methionotrophica TaxID=121620 RepID=A0A8J3PIT3_9ACTN|nr:hypothetical protein [Catellatospora methionotrophica]GIG18079.1 hypothetical protein Cme02nite_64110 [Catellatospora methionotrophica]